MQVRKRTLEFFVLLPKYLLFIRSAPLGFKGVSLQHGESRGRLPHTFADIVSAANTDTAISVHHKF